MSPQPTIDGERIIESGSTQERFAYYRDSSSRNSVIATNFLLAHFPDGVTVQKHNSVNFTSTFTRENVERTSNSHS